MWFGGLWFLLCNWVRPPCILLVVGAGTRMLKRSHDCVVIAMLWMSLPLVVSLLARSFSRMLPFWRTLLWVVPMESIPILLESELAFLPDTNLAICSEFKLSTLTDRKVTGVCERKSMADGLNWSSSSSSSESALNRRTWGVIEPPCFDDSST